MKASSLVSCGHILEPYNIKSSEMGRGIRKHLDSYESEFRLQVHFHYANLIYFCTKTRFETEAQTNLEMAYYRSGLREGESNRRLASIISDLNAWNGLKHALLASLLQSWVIKKFFIEKSVDGFSSLTYAILTNFIYSQARCFSNIAKG